MVHILPSLPFFREASRDKAQCRGCCCVSSVLLCTLEEIPAAAAVGWPEFKLSLEALVADAGNLLWCNEERPRLSVLKRETKDVLFLKLQSKIMRRK